MLGTSLLPREIQINGRLNTSVDKMLKDLEGDKLQRDGSLALCIPWGLVWLKDCDN